MNGEALFRDKVAYFEYTIPFPVFDEKRVRAFYTQWASQHQLDVDMSVEEMTDEKNLLVKAFARDLKLRVKVSDKTPTEVYKIYRMLRDLDYADALTAE